MKKIILTLSLILSMSTFVLAGEINDSNFQGTYRLEGQVGNKKGVLIMVIRAGNVFEVARLYDDGHMGQTCDGKYKFEKVNVPDRFDQDLVMKGSQVSCPNDRQKVYEIELNLKSAKTKDLEKGTWGELYSSEERASLIVKIKKQ